ncbi:MAG: hypothetical protein V4660_05970 [Pseudomonadota bacterium]
MRKPSAIKFYFLVLLIVTTSAKALIIEGNLKATVSDFIIMHGDGSNFGNPTIGSEIYATFWYDTDSFIGHPGVYLNVAQYEGFNNAILSNYQINDKKFNPSEAASDSYLKSSEERIWSQYSDEKYPWAVMDAFDITESTVSVKNNSSDFIYKSAGIFPLVDMTTSSLEQQFSLRSEELFGIGNLNLYVWGYSNGVQFEESVWAELTEFNIGPGAVAVPEPSGLLLFSSLAFLLLGRRFYQTIALTGRLERN